MLINNQKSNTPPSAGCLAYACGIAGERRAQATRPTAGGCRLRIRRSKAIYSDYTARADTIRPYVGLASQSSRLGCRELNSVDFPATCAAENLPEARLMPRPRADQPKGDKREYPFMKKGRA